MDRRWAGDGPPLSSIGVTDDFGDDDDESRYSRYRPPTGSLRRVFKVNADVMVTRDSFCRHLVVLW
jgi:hypothetical protein